MKIYKHYKGGIYIELARGILESSLDRGDETMMTMVTYRAIHNGCNYVRPASEFDGMVEHPAKFSHAGEQIRRFEHIGDTP